MYALGLATNGMIGCDGSPALGMATFGKLCIGGLIRRERRRMFISPGRRGMQLR